MSKPYDILIIGGGINGCGIARDAAGRGLKVLLVEKDDLAAHTSSASSKLIHGGLRYLEHYEFRLVREALAEREVLLAAAPHIIWPMTFVLPHDPSMRPSWLIRLGLFLYDHIGGRRTLPGSRAVELSGMGLLPGWRRGFTYADCWVDDARLVALCALDAAERGAEIATRTACLSARRGEGLWQAALSDGRNVAARALVNAAGPWAGQVLHRVTGTRNASPVRLVKGSHIVLPRLYPGDHAFILQNDDRRIVFAIPYEGRFTLVGTTDVPVEGEPGAAAIDAAERDYLLRVVERYFGGGHGAGDVVWSYSGLRPLFDDGSADPSAVTRDYVLELEAGEGQAALLSVFGGKITTFRRLAEEALGRLRPLIGGGGDWTRTAVLPGGDIGDFATFAAEMARRYPFLPQIGRLARAYGSRAARFLDGARHAADLGEDYGGGLTEAEVDYLVRNEWARTAEDVLWRRSKLGLHVPAGTAARLAERLA
ncbi:MAG: glycerol-3-phosphate dehydrogenase [Thalassobaculales bacterium]